MAELRKILIKLQNNTPSCDSCMRTDIDCTKCDLSKKARNKALSEIKQAIVERGKKLKKEEKPSLVLIYTVIHNQAIDEFIKEIEEMR